MNADLFKANMYKNGMVGRDVANLLGIAQKKYFELYTDLLEEEIGNEERN